jgi:hypothetical protein
MGPVQLEAGEFDGDHVVAQRVPDGIQNGGAHVAGRDGPQSGRLQHRSCQAYRRGLSVGPGNDEPFGGPPPGTLAYPPGKLHIAPDSNPGCCGSGEQGLPRAPAGRGDHEFGRFAVNQRKRLGVLRPQQHLMGTDDFQRVRLGPVFLGVLGVDQNHLRAEFNQGVCRGEAGQTYAGDYHPQPGPVCVPGCQ